MFYTGFTDNLTRRIEEHNLGMSSATKGRRPFELIYYEFCLNPRDARRRERYLKATWGKRYIKSRISNYLNEANDST
jgi:putative endonuclease